MKNKNLINCGLLLWITALIITVSSCSSIKNVKYFTNISDSGKMVRINTPKFIDPVIQPDDILSINIQTVEPSVTQGLALGNVQSSAVGNTSTGSTGGQTLAGYTVDKYGDVELAILGKIRVAGLTTEQARGEIRKKAAVDYNYVAVNVKFANFKITVLGEVNKPGTYVVSNEKVNILDALGLAGDLTIYGQRDNVLLIRRNDDGTSVSVRLDLTKSNVLTSPYYYLRQNDYLYITPIKTKVVANDAIQGRNINILTAVTASLISLIAIIISTRR